MWRLPCPDSNRVIRVPHCTNSRVGYDKHEVKVKSRFAALCNDFKMVRSEPQRQIVSFKRCIQTISKACAGEFDSDGGSCFRPGTWTSMSWRLRCILDSHLSWFMIGNHYTSARQISARYIRHSLAVGLGDSNQCKRVILLRADRGSLLLGLIS
jgi:hypothetical protein